MHVAVVVAREDASAYRRQAHVMSACVCEFREDVDKSSRELHESVVVREVPVAEVWPDELDDLLAPILELRKQCFAIARGTGAGNALALSIFSQR
ncbi:hypothetical protein N9L19_00065 [bacterium]|nr:hypothetical protein [bacterium]